MTPVVTVGISFFNEAPFLAAAIQRVLRQTTRELEVILVDDGSADESLVVARGFQHDARVRVLSDGQRRHLPARLNQIVRSARGRFIARMDGDDLCHPDRFARQLVLFERASDLDVVGTWSALIDREERPLAVLESDGSSNPRVALTSGLLTHASVLGRTDWFRANPYDETLTRAEDRDLWCRTVRSSRFGVVHAPLYIVRVLPRGRDFLADYRESQRQNRVLFRRYGAKTLGLRGAARAYAASLAKSGIMAAAVPLGLADQLVRRRGRPPTPDELRLIREAID
jgi:glycosyltransferase involved in cell wall biosynthesis